MFSRGRTDGGPSLPLGVERREARGSGETSERGRDKLLPTTTTTTAAPTLQFLPPSLSTRSPLRLRPFLSPPFFPFRRPVKRRRPRIRSAAGDDGLRRRHWRSEVRLLQPPPPLPSSSVRLLDLPEPPYGATARSEKKRGVSFLSFFCCRGVAIYFFFGP